MVVKNITLSGIKPDYSGVPIHRATKIGEPARDFGRELGQLDNGDARGMLLNTFTFREVHLRGLVSTGRAAEAVQIMHHGRADAMPAAPQWHIIEGVMTGQIHLAAGNRNSASQALRAALTAAPDSARHPHGTTRRSHRDQR